MASVGLVSDERFLLHDTGLHPERAERLRAITDHLHRTGLWNQLHHLQPTSAAKEDILRVHSEAHFARIMATVGRRGHIDPDTVYSEQSAELALLAAGAALTAVHAVLHGTVHRAMALVRPPGHHATRDRAMGFCFFNNVAITARFLQQVYTIKRIAIVDFDVHHGNGTQDIFYEDGDVFFFSIHEDNLFPAFSGGAAERGRGPGEGTTLNVPVPPGCPRADYFRAYEKALDKVFAFKPEFVLVSAGFDAHMEDPLGGLKLRSEDFNALTRLIIERARGTDVRGIVSVLEGGYHLQGLAESVGEHLTALGEWG
jgi:acetoin utilization deacetylase AcuC-like enzyme